MNGRIDVGDWGSVVDSGSPEELLQTNLEDGVYEVAEPNGASVDAALWSEIITFHSILSNSE